VTTSITKQEDSTPLPAYPFSGEESPSKEPEDSPTSSCAGQATGFATEQGNGPSTSVATNSRVQQVKFSNMLV
jgi:hypothetical protein